MKIEWFDDLGSLDFSSSFSSIEAHHVNVSSEKAMLKITLKEELHGSNAHLFLFTSGDALKERDSVKEFISDRLSECRRSESHVIAPQVPSSNGKNLLSFDEIKLRSKLLSSDKKLFSLHKDLVMGGLISDQEFWENRANLLQLQELEMNQSKGLSSIISAPVRPQRTPNSDVKYILTPSLIEAIFFQFPNSF